MWNVLYKVKNKEYEEEQVGLDDDKLLAVDGSGSIVECSKRLQVLVDSIGLVVLALLDVNDLGLSGTLGDEEQERGERSEKGSVNADGDSNNVKVDDKGAVPDATKVESAGKEGVHDPAQEGDSNESKDGEVDEQDDASGTVETAGRKEVLRVGRGKGLEGSWLLEVARIELGLGDVNDLRFLRASTDAEGNEENGGVDAEDDTNGNATPKATENKDAKETLSNVVTDERADGERENVDETDDGQSARGNVGGNASHGI